jgi:hypothetical protein
VLIPKKGKKKQYISGKIDLLFEHFAADHVTPFTILRRVLSSNHFETDPVTSIKFA